MINVKQIAKFVVGLGDKVAPTDIEEGMRVGVDRTKYQVGFFYWKPYAMGGHVVPACCHCPAVYTPMPCCLDTKWSHSVCVVHYG